MPSRQQLHITLDLEQGADPLRGTLQTHAGDSIEFWGWLQLIQRIEDAITSGSPPEIATPTAAQPKTKSEPTQQEDSNEQQDP
jgi:hypothetical protein